MRYNTFPKTGWSVSALGMGCWGLGGQYGPVEEKTAIDALRRAVDLGVNLFDTADAYGLEMGTSEQLLGKGLRETRERVFIATKVGNWGRRFGHPLPYTHVTHVYGCCDASLQRLRTDRIDLYQCHISDLPDPTVFIEAFEHLVQRGKIRAYGISTNNLASLQRFNANGKTAVCQLDYSLLNRAPENDILPYCQHNNIGTLIRGPLAQGLLSGRFTRETRFTDSVRSNWNEGRGREQYLARIEKVERLKTAAGQRSLTAVALQFVLAHPAVTCVIPGAKTPAQIEELAAAASDALGADQRNRFAALS
jgi:myo-inositol catabolism protein IolS